MFDFLLFGRVVVFVFAVWAGGVGGFSAVWAGSCFFAVWAGSCFFAVWAGEGKGGGVWWREDFFFAVSQKPIWRDYM